MNKQIKSSDWLTRGYSEEELANIKEQAIKEAEAELRNKQIEEMAKDLACNICWDEDEIPTINCLETATRLFIKGYRKQSEGEWHAKDNINGRCSIATCSNCGTTKGLAVLLPIETVTRDFPYCEKCGAKMKGGETDA